LRKIDKQDVEFFWEKEQEESFSDPKKVSSEAPVLAYYNLEKKLTI